MMKKYNDNSAIFIRGELFCTPSEKCLCDKSLKSYFDVNYLNNTSILNHTLEIVVQ